MGSALFVEESIDGVIAEVSPGTNGYFLLLRGASDADGKPYDLEAGHYAAGNAGSWGSGKAKGISLQER